MSNSTSTSAATVLSRLKHLKQNSSPEELLELDKAFQQIQEPEVSSSVEATLAQRGSRYGDFTDHARLCQSLKDCLYWYSPGNSSEKPFHNLDAVKKQALEVIMDKVARILSGDPNYDDNWHDIQGYAKLVEDRLPKEKKES